MGSTNRQAYTHMHTYIDTYIHILILSYLDHRFTNFKGWEQNRGNMNILDRKRRWRDIMTGLQHWNIF